MKVYKYRSGGNELTRDLNSIYKNYLFAPNAKELNDPCETLVLSDNLDLQLNIFSKVFKRIPEESRKSFYDAVENLLMLKKELGIYSLSKTFNHELLWAHYANNHKGFCIEYDFDTLMNNNKFYDFNSFEIKYSKKPPQIELQHLVGGDHKDLMKKLAGVKSKGWEYENEIRIITDKSGLHDYDFQAVTGVYFGYRMPESDRDRIMERLKGRNLNYYEIDLEEKSYKFQRKEVQDKFLNSRKYLYQPLGKELSINYSISEQKYLLPFLKGELTIVLDDKVSLEELEKLGKELRFKLFRSAKTVYIFYHLKHTEIISHAWGITHFDESKKQIEILGITKEDEIKFKNFAHNDNRNRIGCWIDETRLSSLITLYEEEGKVYKEILYSDSSSSITEQVVESTEQGKKYTDIDERHGEFIVITETGGLEYYSDDGLFNVMNNNLQQ